jgi:hypothetical protein
MDFVGVMTLVVSIVSLIYAFLSVAYPQIECRDYVGQVTENMKPGTIRLANIGDSVKILQIDDINLYLNPKEKRILPSYWRYNEELVLSLNEDLNMIPHDFEVGIVLLDNTNKVFYCKVKKGVKHIEIHIDRKVCGRWVYRHFINNTMG